MVEDQRDILKQVEASSNGAPKDPQSYVQTLGNRGFFSEQDSTQEAIMQLFEVPESMTDLGELRNLLMRSDLPDHQVKLVSRVLALSEIFDPGPGEVLYLDEDDQPVHGQRQISIPRVIVAWYLIARIAKNREGRREYAEVLGYKIKSEMEDDV